VAFPRLVAALDITKLAQPTLESIMVGGVLASLTKIWILWSWFSGHCLPPWFWPKISEMVTPRCGVWLRYVATTGTTATGHSSIQRISSGNLAIFAVIRRVSCWWAAWRPTTGRDEANPITLVPLIGL